MFITNEELLKIVRGGDVSMESGVVNANHPNPLVEHEKWKTPSEIYRISNVLSPKIADNTVEKKKHLPIGIDDSVAFPGDTTATDNAIKKLGVERFSAGEFSGRLSDLVRARWGMPLKPVKDGVSDLTGSTTYPFDIDVDFGLNTASCTGIKLKGVSLAPHWGGTSFIFISSNYNFFLGEANAQAIIVRRIKFTGVGKKLINAIRDNYTLDDGITLEEVFGFIYCCIDSYDSAESVYSFNAIDGTPAAYGWHFSYQPDLSKNKLKMAVICRELAAGKTETLQCTLHTVELNLDESINEDGNYVFSWIGSYQSEDVGQYRPYHLDYLWTPSGDSMIKQTYPISGEPVSSAFVYCFFDRQDDELKQVKYQYGSSGDTIEELEENKDCGLYTKNYYQLRAYTSTGGFRAGSVSNISGHQGWVYETTETWEVNSSSVGEDSPVSTVNSCGTPSLGTYPDNPYHRSSYDGSFLVRYLEAYGETNYLRKATWEQGNAALVIVAADVVWLCKAANTSQHSYIDRNIGNYYTNTGHSVKKFRWEETEDGIISYPIGYTTVPPGEPYYRKYETVVNERLYPYPNSGNYYSCKVVCANGNFETLSSTNGGIIQTITGTNFQEPLMTPILRGECGYEYWIQHGGHGTPSNIDDADVNFYSRLIGKT